MRRAISFLHAVLCIDWFSPGVQAQPSGSIPLKAATFYPPEPYYTIDADVTAVERTNITFRVFVDRFTKEESKGFPLALGTLHLRLSWAVTDGPVPAYVGQKVSLRLSPTGEVLVFRYTLDRVFAGRRKTDGRWEFVVTPFYDYKKGFLRLTPRAFSGNHSEVRWTKKYGLLMAGFADGGYGGGEAKEIESSTSRKLGWAIANQPGQRILPGRDGWIRFPDNRDNLMRGKDTDRWMANEVLASQRLPNPSR